MKCRDNKLGDCSLQQAGLFWCIKPEKTKLIHNPMFVSEDTASRLRRVLSSFALHLPHGGTQWKSALCPRVWVLHHLLPETDLLSDRVQLHLLFAYFCSACRVRVVVNAESVLSFLMMVNSLFFSLQRHPESKLFSFF